MSEEKTNKSSQNSESKEKPRTAPGMKDLSQHLDRKQAMDGFSIINEGLEDKKPSKK